MMEIILKYFSDFTTKQLEQLYQLGPLYKEWNEKINVVSRKDIGSLYEKHVLHSLSIAAAFEFQDGSEIVDLGTGGGFPGVPLAIYFPKVNFLLVDSIAKKLKVVESAVENLGLKNVTCQHCRIEDITNRKFDFVVSRAVSPLGELWRWSKPILRSGGNNNNPNGLICLKGGDLAAEINESRLKPRIIEISSIFQEEYYTNKYILFIPK